MRRSLLVLAIASLGGACAPAPPPPPRPETAPASAVPTPTTTVEVVSAPTPDDAVAAIASYQASIPPPSPPLPDLPRTTMGPMALRSALMRCVESATKRDPKVGGKVRIEVVVRTDGTVKRARAIDVTIPDEALVTCLVTATTRVRFEPPAEETVLVIPLQVVPGT